MFPGSVITRFELSWISFMFKFSAGDRLHFDGPFVVELFEVSVESFEVSPKFLYESYSELAKIKLTGSKILTYVSDSFL